MLPPCLCVWHPTAQACAAGAPPEVARGGEKRGERGLSLIEATVVLAVASLLSAALAPSVRNYVQTAQQSAAKADVEAIGSAMARFLADVGESWIMRDGNGAAVTNPPSHDTTTNRVDLLVSDGKIPAVQTPRGAGTDWNAAINNAAVQELDYYLVINTPSNLAANAHRAADDMSVLTEFDPNDAATFNSEFAWRGPYLPGPIGADPWGYRYSVNVEFLARALGAGPSGNVNDVVVISGGNNSLIETRFDTDGFTNGNDVIHVFSGGTR